VYPISLELHIMLPTFIIAGAEKTGSTSLYNYLRQHPDVFMSTPKEPDFFLNEDYKKNIESYLQLFANAGNCKALGEASVSYFNKPQTAYRIKEALSNPQVILVLRHPAERAYSHYNMLVDHGVVPNRSYHEVVQSALKEGNLCNTGIPTSSYAPSLRVYKEQFQGCLLTLLYRDFKSNPISTCRRIFNHIDVDDQFAPDVSNKSNVSSRPRSSFLHLLMREQWALKALIKQAVPANLLNYVRKSVREVNSKEIPPLHQETRRMIIEHLRGDIEETESLVGYSLAHWKE